MPSDQKPASPEQARLAEYELWDRVEGRLWSRARLILLAAVVLVLVVAFLGVPLVEERLERRLTERAESRIAESAAAIQVDLPALRQEIRDETQIQREELIRIQAGLDRRIANMMERSAELEEAGESYEAGALDFESTMAQIRQIQQSARNEEERLHKLRITHERELQGFRDETAAMLAQIPRNASRQLRFVEDTVNRDLDELRLIIADQMAGKPAIYSTYVKLDQRDGQITGLNFGEERGNVFVRLRAFESGGAEPYLESESILLQSTQWSDARINLRFPAPALEKLQEARHAAEAKTKKASSLRDSHRIRYGFVVQTASGKMSQWSGLRADSIVPPTDRMPKDE